MCLSGPIDILSLFFGGLRFFRKWLASCQLRPPRFAGAERRRPLLPDRFPPVNQRLYESGLAPPVSPAFEPFPFIPHFHLDLLRSGSRS